VLDDEFMKTAPAEPGPAVSRLCVVTAGAGIPGPLTAIQRSGSFQRLYLRADPATGTELAVATPGLDEVYLITDLIASIFSQVMKTPRLARPVVAGFHVGVTRMIGGHFRGQGTMRARAMAWHPAILAACARPAAGARATLAVAITAGLFEELQSEGLPGLDWQHVPAAGARLAVFDSTPEPREGPGGMFPTFRPLPGQED
jgi:hypothetical protein